MSESRTAEERARKRIAEIWERGLPEMRARLDVLERTATALASGSAEVSEAAGIAHKLAGSLGMFGLAEGTRVARELEVELENGAPRAERVEELARELREVMFARGS